MTKTGLLSEDLSRGLAWELANGARYRNLVPVPWPGKRAGRKAVGTASWELPDGVVTQTSRRRVDKNAKFRIKCNAGRNQEVKWPWLPAKRHLFPTRGCLQAPSLPSPALGQTISWALITRATHDVKPASQAEITPLPRACRHILRMCSQ